MPRHPGHPSDEKQPEEPTEVAQNAAPLLAQPSATLLPLLQQLEHSLPEVKELPTDLTEGLQMRVRRGVLPEGPRELLEKGPESPKLEILPVEAPETAEAVVQAEAPKLFSEDASPEEMPAKAPEMPSIVESPRSEKASVTEIAEVRSAEVPEGPVKMPEGLHLEIRDAEGRWELGVVRENQTVHLEFHGNPELRKIVQDSTREVGERLARHGDTLGNVSWRPIASASSSSSEQHLGDQRSPQDFSQQQQPQQQPKNPSEQAKAESQPQKSASSSPPPQTTRRALRVI